MSGVPWDDQSGERLRAWMGIGEAQFYDPQNVAILPMGFCYPGVASGGGDKPPVKRCAPTWHQRIIDCMPEIQLTLLVGGYAQKFYNQHPSRTLTDTVAAFRDYLPTTLPLPHPSLARGWLDATQPLVRGGCAANIAASNR
ncbi:uracil-DNA glycosylase family protein [Devosia algicola]|uniref:Uracil-DNA glycosylase family protein n=1 Tax=Devosia algicola TaxID=3026418 RepID=A0ABY7YQ53_9HYPH|nr:uracil-DNA glycosylase family protein [Devosia algicola]WDR03268.1 uracil-DNA glycosylase family protein [Devosia algicola]